MKHLLIMILLQFLNVNGMNSTENRQILTISSDLISEVRREMRSLYMYGVTHGMQYSKEVYNVIDTLADGKPLMIVISGSALTMLKARGFVDEDGVFDQDKLDAWKFIKCLGEIDNLTIYDT